MRRAAPAAALLAALAVSTIARAQAATHSDFGQAVAEHRSAYNIAFVEASLSVPRDGTAASQACAGAFSGYLDLAERSLGTIEDFVQLDALITDPGSREALRLYFQPRAERAPAWVTLSEVPVREACATSTPFLYSFEAMARAYRALLAVMQGGTP
ncbi:MAG: hypothetical protein J0L52_09305 [Caulobacterales bacterium]|nr:hypothetical protein [Caulobacterales bacterium]